MVSRWQKELVSVAVLVLLAGIAYGFLWRPGLIPYSDHSDIIAQHIATKTIAYRNWTTGQGLPFWRSDQNSGGPALTHPQTLYTHPFHLLFFFLRPAGAVGGTLWFQFLVMGIGFYVLGGAMGLGFWARLLMAVAGLFNFKCIMMAYAGWLPVIPIVALTPLFIASIFYLLKHPGPCSGLLLAVTGTLCLHSGNLQIFYYALLFLGTYVLLRTIFWLGGEGRLHAIRVTIWLPVGTALAIAMTAYLLLPLAAEASLTSRVDASYDFFLGGNPLSVQHLLTLIYPEALGSPIEGTYAPVELWEHVAYFGVIPLVLAILGVAIGWHRAYVPFLAVGLALSVYLTVDSSFTRILFDYLPGYRLFRGPNRFLFLTAIFGIALAGVGIESCIRFLSTSKRVGIFAPILPLILISAMTGEGLYYVHRYLHMLPQVMAVPQTRYQEYISSDRSVFRIAPLSRATINYGWAAPMGLELVTGFDAYNLNHYQHYFDLLQYGEVQPPRARVWTDLNTVERWDLLDALNVKYLVTPEPIYPPPAQYEMVVRFEDEPTFAFYEGMRPHDLYLYRNRQALPRAFWAEKVVMVKDLSEAIDQIKSSNLRETAIVLDREDAESPLPAGGRVAPAPSVLHASDGHLSLRTQTRDDSFLVISEVWHPGWRARLDGRPIDLHQTNLALMGTWVERGSHVLKLTFRPLFWSWAVKITLIGMTIFFVLVLYQIWRRIQRRGGVDGR